MSERLSERERIRAILLNKTPLEAADWHLAEVKRIVEPLVKVNDKYKHLKTLIKDVGDNDTENMFHIVSRDMTIAMDETLKRAGGE